MTTWLNINPNLINRRFSSRSSLPINCLRIFPNVSQCCSVCHTNTLLFAYFKIFFLAEFKSNESTFNEALKKIAQKRTSSFIKSVGAVKKFDLIPIEKKFDKFGPWQIDPLFSHMKVYVILSNEEKFPNIWRTDSEVSLQNSSS
jgi:hypothetical protein